MTKAKSPQLIDITEEEFIALDERIKAKQLLEADYILFGQMCQFVVWVQIKLYHSKITMRKLKELLFGRKSEKRAKTTGPSEAANSPKEEDKAPQNNGDTSDKVAQTSCEANESIGAGNNEKARKKGHGRMAASCYRPDEIIEVMHNSLKPGDACPFACGGKIYSIPVTPGGIIRIRGQSCAHIVSYRFNRLRCALCGETFTPDAPVGFSDEKYDECFKALMAVNKYFVATPFYRQERYLGLMGVPLSDATQWDCIMDVAESANPVLPVLEAQAANGENLNHDDTHVKILSLMAENIANPDKKRKGMYTTCVLARAGSHEICLYYSGAQHGGENVAGILKKRDMALGPIHQMCDALAANTSSEFETILAHCLTHGRRKFVELDSFFVDECAHVIGEIGKVYYYEAQTKKENMSKEERLSYHQEHSKPIMDALYLWMQQQIDEGRIEPNGPLYAAIRYMQKHWAQLTRFLSVAGADLDNNCVERALKLAIRVRKNAMFYKTLHGAEVGALLLSLIATSELAKKNPVHYLTALQKNKAAVLEAAHLWLPWNYEDNLKDSDNHTEAITVPYEKVA
jgi:transposase